MSRESVEEKAARLLAENRVFLSRRHRNCAIVCGDHDVYQVWSEPEGVTCECYADSAPRAVPRCSHAIAAMVAWYERMYDSPFGPTVDAPLPADGFAALVGGAA